MHAVIDSASMCREIKHGCKVCTSAQLTIPVLEAMLPALSSLLQQSSCFSDAIRKQLTVPLINYILKDLISEGKTAAAMDTVTRA